MKIHVLCEHVFFEVITIAIKIKKRYQGRQREQNDIVYNERIKANKVLVIDETGQKLGELSIDEALELAFSKNLDLIQVSSNKNLTVTKIADFGKYRFEKRKKQQEAKKNQKVVENKEVRLTPNIGQHDLDVKIKKAREFLEKGNKVKISLKFRGRQLANKDVGFTTINKFVEAIEDIAVIDKEPKLKGYFLDVYVSPKNK